MTERRGVSSPSPGRATGGASRLTVYTAMLTPAAASTLCPLSDDLKRVEVEGVRLR